MFARRGRAVSISTSECFNGSHRQSNTTLRPQGGRAHRHRPYVEIAQLCELSVCDSVRFLCNLLLAALGPNCIRPHPCFVCFRVFRGRKFNLSKNLSRSAKQILGKTSVCHRSACPTVLVQSCVFVCRGNFASSSLMAA